jgi:hypothetical protein
MPWWTRPSCLLALIAVAGVACGGGSGSRGATRPTETPIGNVQPTPSQAPVPSPAASPATPHVFVIVMENRSYLQAVAGGYTAGLARNYRVATNYHGVTHPSLPNYLAMTSGSTWGVADDGWHPLPPGGLGAQLTDAGISWRAYMEGMNNGCFHSGYPYALKHNPFAYYGSSCPAQVVPFTSFASDMAGANVPQFVWITPGLCHDGHDCSTAVADAWLAQTVPTIMATSAWKDGGVLLITWDEGEDSANSVLTLVIRPDSAHATSARRYDHYALLATIEDQFGLKRLGAAGGVFAMTDLMAP